MTQCPAVGPLGGQCFKPEGHLAQHISTVVDAWDEDEPEPSLTFDSYSHVYVGGGASYVIVGDGEIEDNEGD